MRNKVENMSHSEWDNAYFIPDIDNKQWWDLETCDKNIIIIIEPAVCGRLPFAQ